MTKNNVKKIFIGSLGIIGVAGTIATSVSFAAKSLTPKSFYFDGRIFKNSDEALTYLIRKNKIKVKSKKVLGNISRSYANIQSGELLKANLPDYDVSNVELSYFKAGGARATYEDAKSSYYNPGLIKTKFIDGFNGTFASELDAQNSMRSHSLPAKIGFYDVDVFRNDKNSTIKARLNPFSEKDVNDYKENIKKNIFNILLNNITNNKNKKYDIYSYPSENHAQHKFEFNVGKIIERICKENDEIKKLGFDYDDKSNTLSSKYLENNISSKFKANSRWIGDYAWNERHHGTFSTNIKYRAANYDDLWLWKTLGSEIYNESSFISMLNAGGGDGWIKPIYNKKINDLSKQPDEEKNINKFITAAKQIISSDKDIIKKSFNDSYIIQNDIFKNYLNGELSKSLETQLDNAFSNNKTRTFKLTDISNFTVNRINTGFFGKQNEISIPEQFATFKYLQKAHIGFDGEVATIDNKLLYSLLNWKSGKSSDENYKFKVKYNERALFNVTLSAKNGKPYVKSIEIDNENQHGVFSKDLFNLNKMNSNPNSFTDDSDITKYLYSILYNLHLDLSKFKETDDANLFKDAFGKYFGKDSYYFNIKNNINYKFDEEFDSNYIHENIYIIPKNILKMYLSIINEAYEKYSSEPGLLKIMSRKIPNPKNILVINKTVGINKEMRLNFGRYLVKSISDFNLSTLNGRLSISQNNGNLATTFSEWTKAKTNITYTPAKISILYDSNGQEVNAGGYLYDSEVLLKYNSLLNIDPRRDYNNLFINIYRENGIVTRNLVENIITTIYSVEFDDETHWFQTFNQLRKYMIKYIQENGKYV